MIKLKVANSRAARAALKTEIANPRLEIDGSYGNLKLAQDAQRKSIIATEKLVEEAENQDNSQDKLLPRPSLPLDEDQIIAEEVKINMECEQTEKQGVQNEKFNNFQ